MSAFQTPCLPVIKSKRPAILFILILLWKVALLMLSTQPVPSNDAFFYDGPVVNFLLHGKYANPSLVLSLPISGSEIFCAYPPLYQFFLMGWCSLFGVSAIAPLFFHLLLFALYLGLLWAIFRRLNLSEWTIAIATAFLLVITFHDRPDSLAHVFGIASVYFLIRSRASLDSPLQEAFTTEAHRASSPQPSPPKEERESGSGQKLGFHPSRQSPRKASTWAAVGFIILSLATGLQIGAVYFLLVFVGMIMTTILAKESFPIVPMAAMCLIPAALLTMVILGFPHLWAGFLEHARQTPSLTGFRIPRPNEVLKTIRTVPGVLAVVALMPFWVRGAKQNRPVFLITFVCTFAAFAAIAASLFVLTPNFVFFGSYLQPLIVGCFLGLIRTSHFSSAGTTWKSSLPGYTLSTSLAAWLFVGLAALGSIRAVGMSTWGLACAADVGYTRAIDRVRAELSSCPRQSATVLSSAFLYEAARHDNVRWYHSDWLSPAGEHGPEEDLAALLSLKPRKIILTQFDYFRRYEMLLAKLKSREEQTRIDVLNTARTRSPDSFPSLQKVVQHISWAPVIITISWQ